MDKKLFAELKVGDKVLVRDDLQVGSVYGVDSFASNMEPFLGKVGTVAEIHTHCILLEEVEYFYWTPEMLVGKVITGEEQKESVETEKAPHKFAIGDTEDTEKKHRYAVGQKVRVTNNGRSEDGLVGCCWGVGKEVTVTALEVIYANGEPMYKCKDGCGMFQYMPESQLESADYSGNHLDIEVGKVYTALTNLGITWVIKVEDIDSNKVYHKAALCCNDDYFAEGGWFLIDNMIEIEEATAEQEEQLLRAKVDAGVMSADELPFNNPERESGKVYIPCDWRIATAAEQKKLEDAEKAHGCDYRNTFVNKKGTVIHVDGYYVHEAEFSITPVIVKITAIHDGEVHFLPELTLDGQWNNGRLWAPTDSVWIADLRHATSAEITMYEKALQLKEAVKAVKSE